MTPGESVASAAERAISNGAGAPACSLDRSLADELWRACDAAIWGLEREEFDRILIEAGTAQNFGLPDGAAPAEATQSRQAAWLRGLCLGDLALARACARGHERAWEHFVTTYRQALTRAAIAITGSETLGRDLADQLYAEIYGLNLREGQRRSPLDSYRGRGSLMSWLRTTLAQRHVDHYRRVRREKPIEEWDAPAPDPPEETPARELSLLECALAESVSLCAAEDRFLLAAYYLDGQTLLQIARLLGVHEATVSRKLHRATGGIRKQILKNLRRRGLSRRAAEEAMRADPRDIEVNLKKLLQYSQLNTFIKQAAP